MEKRGKISPPYLKKKIGIFATRTPHRPNPIGITLAKIDKIDKNKRIIYISGIDLVEGTPVLDIKPYINAYDSITPSKIPEWLSISVPSRRKVEISNDVIEYLNYNLEKILKGSMYSNISELLNSIKELFSVDVRSERQHKLAKNSISTMPYDTLIITFKTNNDDSIVIEKISL